MTHRLQTVRVWSSLILACILLTSVASSAPFTAVASGNWSAAATWGVAAPNFNNTIDQITIPAGITVTMDNNATINGALASMIVAGTLTGGANSTLTITQGSLSGAGAINVGTLVMGAGSTLAFTGALAAEYLNTASTAVQSAAQMTISKGLNLTGGVLTMAAGGSLALANDATITVSGGTLALSGGALNLANAYNVRYITSAATTGLELSGAGLKTVIFDVPVGTVVTLGNNLIIGANGALNLTGGTLNLNGRDLTVNGAMTGAANTLITSTAMSSITLNSLNGVVGMLNFAGTANAVKNLTVNVGNGATTAINGALTVAQMLNLQSGALSFAGSTLTLAGNVIGAGALSGDATSNLVINTVGGIANPLRFAVGGQTINNLTTNVGAGNSVKLASDLVVMGATTLTSGNLDISNANLTLGGALSGAGTLVTNANSGLMINTPGGLTSPISFTGGTIGDLGVNVAPTSVVTLGNDLVVARTLTLTGGTLVLNGNDLTVAGNIVSDADGFVRSTATSDINITSPTGTTGMLNFEGFVNAVKNLTVNVGAAGSTAINGVLTVANALDLQSGTLNFAGSTLNLNGAVTGAGSLSGSNTSNLVVNAASGVGSGLRFATGGQTVNNLIINAAGGTVKLLTDLTVAGATTLTSGNLDISDNDLAIGGALTGAGTIISNANSGLMINTPGGLTSPISVTGGSIGDFGVNVGPGNTVTLGSDLNVTKTLTLSSGTLVLNGNDLSIDGNIVGGVNGFVRSTAASNIDITSPTGTTGVLNFAANSAVGSLITDVGASNVARIGGDVDVMNALSLTSGTLNFAGADLTLNGLVTGTGMLAGDAASNLTINSVGGLATGLGFAQGGQILNNLIVNVGAANAVKLASDLVVNGTTTLTSGTLDISDVDFTIGGALSGVGSIATNANSALSIIGDAGLTAPLNLTGSAIGDLIIDVTNASSVILGSDLNVTRKLDLESGRLILNGNDLNISGIIDATGTGTISSTNASDISITSVGSAVGRLMFDAAGNIVNDLTIAAGNGGSIALGTDATVNGVLNLTSGRLNIADNVLTIGTNGSIVGGNTTSFVQTALNGAVSMAIDAGASVPTVFPVGTANGFFPASISLAPSSASGNVNVGVREGVQAQGTMGSLLSATESVVNATWDITSDIASNLRMNMELAWQAVAEVNGFNRAQAYISHYINGAWDASAMAAAMARAEGMYSIKRDDVQSLSPFAIFDGATTDVTTSDITSNYNVYPSPATDVITIENLASAVSMNIDIVDAQGRIVASSVMNGTRHDISLSALSSGVYFIKLHNETSIATMRFIKI